MSNDEMIGLYRGEDETWYDAGVRFTSAVDLDRTFEDHYYNEIRVGEDDFSACMIALEKLGFCLAAEDYRDDDS